MKNLLKFRFGILVLALVLGCRVMAAEKLLDFWGEETKLFATGDAKKDVSATLKSHASNLYVTTEFTTDNSEKVCGDFSILYTPAADKKMPLAGFVSSLWGQHWDISGDAVLNMSIKFEPAPAAAAKLSGEFIDKNGVKAAFTIDIAPTADWQKLSVKVKDCAAAAKFDFSAVKLCQFDMSGITAQKIRFDGIFFEANGRITGVTDKSLAQRNAEAAQTQDKRIEVAFADAARKPQGPIMASYFASLYIGKDIEATDKLVMEELSKPEMLQDPWDLYMTPALCRIYYLFSSKSDVFPGRISPETEKKLLEVLWERTKLKNDINWARQSTWWMDGSENHDLNAKVCNLVTSRIFMNEPEYKDRLYPDLGYGGGYHYGHAGYYGPDAKDRNGGGRANISDGKQYNAAEHYEAWLAFIKEYFVERTKRGFFLERASRTYNKHTMNFVDLAYAYSGDAKLKQIVDDFMDLFYTDWAMETITAIRGGSKTRYHHVVQATDPMEDIVGFYLGGPGNGRCFWYWGMINGYQMPDMVKQFILDRESLGTFEYASRCIGEEQNIWPRPMGTERTMICDTFSRMVNYSYVTPDYVLSCRMDHPALVHSHLSIVGHWHGMNFANSAASRIVPFSTIREKGDTAEPRKEYDMECVFKSAQDKNVLITQQAHRWFQVVPDWYPSQDFADKTIGVYFGSDWDKMVEKDGWIFVCKGNAYAAVRPVMWDEEFEKQKKLATTGTQVVFNAPDDDPTVKITSDSYKWIDAHTVIELKDKYAPVIIEAGRRETYNSLDAFIADVLDNPIALYKTVVPGFHVLVYTGTNGKEIVFNATGSEISTIGGEYIDYEFPYTFKSPYFESQYNSGIVKITKDGKTLDYDFNK